MPKNLFMTTAMFLVMTVPTLSAGETPTLELEPLVLEALENNPQLAAVRYETDAASEKIRQAGAWDPPQVGIEFMETPVGSFPNFITEDMRYDYYIQQMIPFPGKTSSMEKAAEKNREMVGQNIEVLRKRVVRDLKAAYYELYFVQHKILINRENQDLMREFTATARKQYEVGMGNQADILKAQTELSMLINEGVNLLQEKISAEAMLDTILNRSADQPFGRVPDLNNDRTMPIFEKIKPLALKHRPELLSMRAGIDMNIAEVSVAEREQKPDFMLRFTYNDVAGTTRDSWSTMVGVTIPLAPWSADKFKGKVEETRINVMKAKKDLAAMENMVLFEVRDALARVESQRNLMGLFKTTVIPQAEQTLQSVIASYQTGNTEFMMVIDTSRTLLSARLEYHMAVMNLMTGLASLEQAVGLSLEDIVVLSRQNPGAKTNLPEPSDIDMTEHKQ